MLYMYMYRMRVYVRIVCMWDLRGFRCEKKTLGAVIGGGSGGGEQNRAVVRKAKGLMWW